MNAPTITVLGSANMDFVVTVNRLPTAGETVTGSQLRLIPGGKGANQALAAARAGATVRFLGAVGTDPYGATIRDLLAANGIDVTGLATADSPTGTAHICVDHDGRNHIVVVPGANGRIAWLSDEHRAGIRTAQVLLLQLELPLDTVVEAAQFARSCGVRTLLTPAPAVQLPAELLAAVDLLVPNEHEAVVLSGVDDPIAAGRRLTEFGCHTLVTLGAAGACYLRPGHDPIRIPAYPVDAIDTTAAGDTFIGAFATQPVSDDTDIAAALRFGAAAAAIGVQRPGASASMPSRAEIRQFLDEPPEHLPC